MPSDKDILSKADALLRRHTAPGSETGAYPVLTDLIDHPDGAAADEIVRDVHARVMAAIELHLAGDLEKLFRKIGRKVSRRPARVAT